MMTAHMLAENDLSIINKLVYAKCGLALSSLIFHLEGAAYSACSFELNGYKVEHRVSKTTPAKSGQFVTIWKRGMEGITVPFDNSDDIDFVVITSRSGENLGQFIFPKAILAKEGVFSKNGKFGKRGIRVYSPWDTTHSKQAAKTQGWQTKYFIKIQGDNTTDLDLIRRLFERT
jgi:hypothetical protein